jgi:hypothetical protein
MLAWNDWYHCMGNTYGTWLPGDRRGFRTRWHREHVEGDYKNPPPAGKYKKRYERAKKSMKREPVYLTDRSSRMSACTEMIASLRRHNIEVIALSADRVHFHLLARFPAHNPRKFVGIAKKDSSRLLTDSGVFEPGGIWAKKSECVPVKNRGHQLKAAKYVVDHYKKGAIVWSIPALRRLVPPANRCSID